MGLPEPAGAAVDVPGDLPIIDKPLPRFLDDAAAAKLLRATRTDPDPLSRLIVELLARTGIRRGELLALTVDAVVQIGSAYWLRIPIGKLHNDRYIPLHPQLKDLLDDWITHHRPADRGRSPAIWLPATRLCAGPLSSRAASGSGARPHSAPAHDGIDANEKAVAEIYVPESDAHLVGLSVVPRSRSQTSLLGPGADIHRVADRCSVQDDSSVVAGDGGAQFGDRFVGACRDDFDAARDGVTAAHRCLEGPIDIQKHRARTRQLLRHNGIQDGTGNPALDDDLPETGRLRRGFVVVQRVAVTADLGEQGDVVVTDSA